MLPQTAEPSWEHVVLGRLHHERILHGFQEAFYSTAEAPECTVDEPHIDGLAPSEITACDVGWTWRQALEPSEASEFKIDLRTAGEAIAKAGYRVTGRGFTATHQWLSFDAAVTMCDLHDPYEMEFLEAQVAAG
jgi:hypothetical protein